MSTTTRIEDLRHEALVNIDNLRVLLSADQLNVKTIRGAAGTGLDALRSQLVSLVGLLDDNRDPTPEELDEAREVLRDLLAGDYESLDQHDLAVGVAALRIYMKDRPTHEIPQQVLKWFVRNKNAPIPAWARTMEALPEE